MTAPHAQCQPEIDRAVMNELTRQSKGGVKYLASLNVNDLVDAICAAVPAPKASVEPADGAREALRPFVEMMSRMTAAKMIDHACGPLTPVEVTVTKAQFAAAKSALCAPAQCGVQNGDREAFEGYIARAGFTDWSRLEDGYTKPLVDRLWRAWVLPSAESK